MLTLALIPTGGFDCVGLDGRSADNSIVGVSPFHLYFEGERV